jgi:HlyD family secretion protein
MPASFAVDAFPRRSFEGEIRQIRKSPQNVQNVVSYTVVISARNPDLALLPGMTANVRIVVEERAAALKVPNAALRFRMPGAAAPSDGPAQKGRGRAAGVRLWVLENGEPAPVQVRLGITDGASTEILEGPLAEGSMVVVGLGPGAAPGHSGPRFGFF